MGFLKMSKRNWDTAAQIATVCGSILTAAGLAFAGYQFHIGERDHRKAADLERESRVFDLYNKYVELQQGAGQTNDQQMRDSKEFRHTLSILIADSMYSITSDDDRWREMAKSILTGENVTYRLSNLNCSALGNGFAEFASDAVGHDICSPGTGPSHKKKYPPENSEGP